MRMLSLPVRCLLQTVAALWIVLVAPTALLRAETAPGSALEFDGVDDVVQIPDSQELHSLPLTVTAWIRTTQNTPAFSGIVSKYAEGSNLGYAVALRAGHIEAWYYADGVRHVWIGEGGSVGPMIADGVWHHVAVVFGTTKALLILDGTPTFVGFWSGQSGACAGSVHNAYPDRKLRRRLRTLLQGPVGGSHRLESCPLDLRGESPSSPSSAWGPDPFGRLDRLLPLR